MKDQDILMASKLLHLNEDEVNELRTNAEAYEGEISELIDAYSEYSATMEKKLAIDSEYSSLNYKLYESFMEVHKNAIIISALRSECSIKKIDLGGEADNKIKRILEKYLIIKKFY